MSQKDRLKDQNGNYLNFTCGNSKFSTDTNKGAAHGIETAKGSALTDPLAEHGGYTLWLEHVVDHGRPDNELYWLMWYLNGIPKIPMSGVLSKEDLCRMSEKIRTFVISD